ncbi:MAG: sigma-E processing peptidase SpoIIGA [Clostridia bacterium]|nr:sigma-E processing peptidase SpoIIGA [Clostridia bacterium]
MGQTTVYFDILFLYNFVMNLLLLFLTSYARGGKFSLGKGALGSSVGSFYFCLLCFNSYRFLEHIMFQLLVASFMIFVTFRVRKIGEFLRLMLLYYLLGFTLAGGIRFSASFFSKNPNQTTLIAVLIGSFLLVICGRFYLESIRQKGAEQRKTICLFYGDQTVRLETFLDTGNRLRDPLDQAGVIVVNSKILKPFLDVETPENVRNLRMIPCRTVMQNEGMLYGFKPDLITCDEKPIRAVVAWSDFFHQEGYDAICNPTVLMQN